MTTPKYIGDGCAADAYCGGTNAPLVAGDGAGIVDSNNSYANNVLYGGLGVQLFDADVNYFSCSNNKCDTNPLFVSVSAGTNTAPWIPGDDNFALQASSPCACHWLCARGVVCARFSVHLGRL